MKLKKDKYIKCFSQDICDQLIDAGYKFLYEKNEVYYLENDDSIAKFSDHSELLQHTESSMWINL